MNVLITHFKTFLKIIACLLLTVSLAHICMGTSWASAKASNKANPVISGNNAKPLSPWYKDIEAEWGGHIKGRWAVSWPEERSIFQPVGTGTFYDGNTEGRLNNRLFFGKWGYLETHYEMILSGGWTRSKSRQLEKVLPGLFRDGLLISRPVEDERRFMDLTKTIDQHDDYILYHRLDRLSLTLLPKWGVVRIGRQAITWGNGLLFNPMDLFNPFPPADIERDYKIADDMVSAQCSIGKIGDLQFLYVPRRKPSGGDLEWNQSSLAGKLHFAWGTTEFDIAAGRHFKDGVVGLGSTGYLRDAAWRLDAIWTFLDEDSNEDDFLSLVANMDYSWVWWEKNFYGFLEVFYNTLGNNQYSDALLDPNISERLDRGELFTLGRTYLSGHMRMELHPLFNVFFTMINNLADPSGILQSWITWDIARDFQITFGGNMFYGGAGTEYGGFKLPGTNYYTKPPDNIFLWLTYFF
jgi:hypothetical protein